MSEVDYRALFAAFPSPHMILDRDLKYVDANPAYEAVTGRSRAELIGHGVFDLFPDEGESGRRLRASLEKALATGEPDTLALIHYAIPIPDRPGEVEDRFWSAVHTPLRGADGAVAYVMQNTVDVTELTRSKAARAQTLRPGEVDILQRVEEVERARQRVQAESDDFRRLFAQAPSAIAVLEGPDHVFAFANDAYGRLVAGRELIGLPLREALPEIVDQGFITLLDGVLKTGERVSMEAAPVNLLQADGSTQERLLDFTYQAVLGREGERLGVFVQAVDVTESARAASRQRLLLDELNHRVKNTLSTVQAIASQTLRSTDGPDEFRQAFEARLQALSRAHDLLVRTQWEGAELKAILADELRPYGPDRVSIQGPNLFLPAREALALSLVMHELTTNAAKYGGLSRDGGGVAIEWKLDRQGESVVLALSWTERGGPLLTGRPERRGFGSRLIERSVTRDLGGHMSSEFASIGLVWRMSMPVSDGGVS